MNHPATRSRAARCPRSRCALALALSAIFISLPCLGQSHSPYQPPFARPTSGSTLERVDPSIADIGPLNTSARVLPADLRLPVGFEHVYRMSGDTNTLMRVSGGLTATFPRSQYAPSRRGLIPEIPAGTVFHIGGVRPSPFRTFNGDVLPPSFNAIDRNASGVQPHISAGTHGVDANPRAPEARPDTEGATQAAALWNDEVYRAFRIRELLRQAANE